MADPLVPFFSRLFVCFLQVSFLSRDQTGLDKNSLTPSHAEDN